MGLRVGQGAELLPPALEVRPRGILILGRKPAPGAGVGGAPMSAGFSVVNALFRPGIGANWSPKVCKGLALEPFAFVVAYRLAPPLSMQGAALLPPVLEVRQRECGSVL